MNFETAYNYMKYGHPISLPEWEGFWYWCMFQETIIIHTEYGEEIDIRDSMDVDFTVNFLFRKDWLLLSRDTEKGTI